MKKLETKIKEVIKKVENLSWQIIKSLEDIELNHLHDDWNYTQEIESDKYQFSGQIKGLIKLILVYIEKQGLPNYLEKFQNEIVNKLTNDYLFEFRFDPELQESSQILEDIKEFLYPFPQFDHISEELETKRVGIRYLENILKQTSYIINKMGLIPTKEVEIYNAIKIVINSTFPKSHGAGSNFRKIGKEYKPDILIPELEVAIEYKYVNSEKKLINCIEQILVDVKGYQDDLNYKIFYSVFYLKGDIVGQNRFDELWAEYCFPKNWKPFYCVGK